MSNLHKERARELDRCLRKIKLDNDQYLKSYLKATFDALTSQGGGS